MTQQPHQWNPSQPPPQQGDGPYQPPPDYVAARRKRKKWPFVLGGVILLIVLIVIIAVSSSNGDGDTNSVTNSGQAPAGAAGAAQPAAAEDITYEVTGVSGGGSGTGIKSSVTYTSDDKFNQSQENGIQLPWTKNVDLGNGFFSGASLIAQAGDGVESITCRILDGGEVISENTSSGQFAVVTCSGN